MLARSDTGAGQPVALIVPRLAAIAVVFLVNLPLSPASFARLPLISMDGARKQERETPMQRRSRLTQWLRDYKRVKQGIKSFLREYGEHSPELLVQTKKRFKKTIKPLRKVKRQYAAKLQQLQERRDAQRCTSPPETFHTPVTTLKQELTGQHRDRLSSAATRLTLTRVCRRICGRGAWFARRSGR